MAIEFRCHACGRLLHTPDYAAGGKARCPECGAAVPVPAVGMAERPTAPLHKASAPAGTGAATPPPPQTSSRRPSSLDLSASALRETPSFYAGDTDYPDRKKKDAEAGSNEATSKSDSKLPFMASEIEEAMEHLDKELDAGLDELDSAMNSVEVDFSDLERVEPSNSDSGSDDSGLANSGGDASQDESSAGDAPAEKIRFDTTIARSEDGAVAPIDSMPPKAGADQFPLGGQGVDSLIVPSPSRTPPSITFPPLPPSLPAHTPAGNLDAAPEELAPEEFVEPVAKEGFFERPAAAPTPRMAEVIAAGWKFFTGNLLKGAAVGTTALVIFGGGVVAHVFAMIGLVELVDAGYDEEVALGVAGIFSAYCGLFLLIAWLQAGFCTYVSNIARGEPALYSNLIRGRNILQMFFVTLITAVCVGLGLALLIVPGVIVFARFSLAGFYVVDRNMGCIEALQASYRATDGRVKWLLLAYLATFGIWLLTTMLPLGVFFAPALAVWILAVLYFRLSGESPADSQEVTATA